MVSKVNQAKAPISSHPAFPAIVALWFAALLGVGSLIVPAVLFEHLFAVTGLSGIFGVTKAPLGFTAKLVIAVAGSIIGAVTGLLLARKVAAGQATPTAAAFAEYNYPGSKRPISAHEELGAESLDQPVAEDDLAEPAPGRRSALFIRDEGVAEDEAGPTPLAIKPLPQAADLDEHEPSDWVDEWADDFAEDISDTDDLDAAEPEEEALEEVAQALPEQELAPQTKAQNPATGMTAAQLISRPLGELGIVQLVERFALSLQQRPANAFTSPENDGEESPEVVPQDAPPVDAFPVPEAMQAEYANEIAPPVAADSVPAELPAALRPVEFGWSAEGLLDDEDDGNEDDDLVVIDWKAAFSASDSGSEPDDEPGDEPEDESDDEEEDEEFSSLLNLRKTATEPRKSVELPDDTASDPSETVAVFPSPEETAAKRKFDAPVAVPTAKTPPSHEGSAAETERTLRDALEQLQKMSGTG